MQTYDVNTEYERIFGTSNYPTLYELQDKEYLQLRQQIIGTAPLSYLSSKLPFEDIYDAVENEELMSRSLEVCTDSQLVCTDELSCYNVVIGLRNYVVDLLTGILSSLSSHSPKNLSVEINNNVDKHMFWVSIVGRCRAYGYLDKNSKNFYIGAESLISVKDDSDYIATSSYRNRHRLIEKYGTLTDNYFKLKKDVKCRSAVAAARYVVGATVNLDLWKDAQGKSLYDTYPEIFFR